jgi:integrase
MANRTSHNLGEKFPAEPLSKDEVIALMTACSKRAPTGKRDRALICILWRGQLRISEALALKPADFDAEKCTLRVLSPHFPNRNSVGCSLSSIERTKPRG